MTTTKIIHTLIIFFLFISIGSYGQYTASSPIVLSGASNMVIQNKSFTSGSSGAAIYLSNCTNIKIINCSFSNIPTYVGVQLMNCTNVEIISCKFDDFYGGVYAVKGTGINVHCNSFTHIVGPKPRGQIVQFNSVSGGGNRINYNISDQLPGIGTPEDLINCYASSGTTSDPLQVVGNKLRGGGPSTSGGGIMIGDNGGHDILVADNILVDPGQYGIGAPAGYNLTIKNNKVYGRQQSFTNVGLYVGLQGEITAGFPCVASSIRVEGNVVNWTRKDGVKNSFYNCPCCSGIISSGNLWNAAIDGSILPAVLSLNSTMCSVSNQVPSVTLTSPINNSNFIAPAGISLTATASDADGSISKVEFYNGTNLLNSDVTAPYSYSWTNVSTGTYSITAKAYDNSGASVISSASSVIVKAPTVSNISPSVSLTSPITNSTFAAPASISISATASDADGSISKVEFYNGTTLLNSDVTAPYSFSWSGVNSGTYTISAKVFDNSGASSASAGAIITVNSIASTIGINGQSCVPSGQSYTYIMNPEFTPYTNISFWSNSSAVITQDPVDHKKVNVQFPSGLNGTTLVLYCGVNYGVSPWYKEYTKSIKVGECSTVLRAAVSPQPFSQSTKVAVDDHKILSVEIFDSKGSLVSRQENLNVSEIVLGSELSTGIYMLLINTEEGSQMIRIMKE